MEKSMSHECATCEYCNSSNQKMQWDGMSSAERSAWCARQLGWKSVEIINGRAKGLSPNDTLNRMRAVTDYRELDNRIRRHAQELDQTVQIRMAMMIEAICKSRLPPEFSGMWPLFGHNGDLAHALFEAIEG